MSQPFLGQIQPFGFTFAPRGWAFCNGQLLSISQNTALFSLLGTQYGGNGTTTFALPDLRSRVPMHFGQGPGLPNYVIGEEGGVETVTLTLAETPVHTHSFSGTSDAANFKQPTAGGALAESNKAGTVPGDAYYAADLNVNPLQPLNQGSVSQYGGSQPHTNLQPYLTINFCIAMQGIFPARN